MALWARTQQLPKDALRNIQQMYNIMGFPIEIRHHFAQWIEEQLWSEIDEKNPNHEQYATTLLNNLLTQIDNRASNTDDFINKLQFQNSGTIFQERYGDNPMMFVQNVKTVLQKEEECNLQAETLCQQGAALMQNEAHKETRREIKRNLEKLDRDISGTDQDLRNMQFTQEKFVIDYQNQSRLQASLNQIQQHPESVERTQTEMRLKAEKEEMSRMLLTSAQNILQQRLSLGAKHKAILTLLESMLKSIVDDELIKWRRHQQLAINGAPFDNTMIDILQSWCESLAELLWRVRTQIVKVDMLRAQLPIDVPQGYVDYQPELNVTVTGLLSNLVSSTFIVEEQPPQVLKKDSRFAATVRLLVGGKLNLHMTPPKVKATIISEQQARGLMQNDESRQQQKCGDILNNEGTMDYHSNSGQLSIKFRSMSLKNIKRADRRGAEVHMVAEEKFCILFRSEFNIGGNELKFQVWTLSLPVIVTVHGNQECQATATYLWDNQFSEPGRIPFNVPDSVTWPDMAKLLSTKFGQMTGRGLSEDNLRYLANKLFNQVGQQDFSNAMVMWPQFNKENLSGRNFTFWEWFWSVGKLVKEQLKAPWNDETIIGFMDKTEANALLMSKPNGTFLLRFSDGTLGGITIAWVADNPDKTGERQVWNLAPFTIKDFSIRGLADRIKDLPALVYLFPDVPKDTAFSKYYCPPADVTAGAGCGYVKTTLINVIENSVGTPMAGVVDFNNPQSPQLTDIHPLSPQSTYSQPAMTPHQDASMEGEGDGASMLLNDFPQEDPEFNRLNEWLTNSGFR